MTVTAEVRAAKPAADERSWTVRELADEFAITTRTLRYYEELGLLAPAEYSTGGARRYAEQDVARLLRIRELQELLGFDLGEIKVVLGAEAVSRGMLYVGQWRSTGQADAGVFGARPHCRRRAKAV